MREPSNLPPGVTDRMIEEQQADVYAGTPYEARAHGLLDAEARLADALHQIVNHRRFRACAVNHPKDCPWPARLRGNPNVEERTRAILQLIAAELDGIDRLILADEEEGR